MPGTVGPVVVGTVRPNQQEDSLEQEEWSGKPSREKPHPVNTVMFDHDRVPKCGIPGAESRPLTTTTTSDP